MKKFFTVLFVLTGFAFAAEAAAEATSAVSGMSDAVKITSIIAAVAGLCVAAVAAAFAMGNTAAATLTGTARNPSVGGKLVSTMFIALAMIEAQVIYALVFGLILFFANPFAG